MLKKQIPIPTFHGWDDAQPGFLEIDVMAHSGTLYEGSYLSTLTLTDSVLGLETILGAFVAGVILKLADGDPMMTQPQFRQKLEAMRDFYRKRRFRSSLLHCR